jgi:hypothetical protein
MQHKNFFEILSLGDVFSKSYWANQKKKIYVKDVFNEISDKMYILPSATFVVFWRVSLLCCFLKTAVYRVWTTHREMDCRIKRRKAVSMTVNKKKINFHPFFETNINAKIEPQTMSVETKHTKKQQTKKLYTIYNYRTND